ncbi:MAG: hypothetical protein RMJ84_11340, partial [Sandaracinaceae bacterium]|nr:hypothetical protein [Sandaracinaceae bacterium]
MPPEFLFALPLFAVEENAGALQPVATLNQKAEREEAPSGDQREEATSSPAQSEPREDEYSAQVRLRRELGQVHRALGITAWASMTLTTALGF